MIFLLYFVTVLFILVTAEKNGQYAGSRVYKIKIDNTYQQENYHLLRNKDIDFWKNPSIEFGVAGLAMVPPSYFDWFEGKLEKLDIEKDIFAEDAQTYLNQQEAMVTDATKSGARAFDFDGYHRYEEILNHLYSLRDSYANSTSITFELVQYGITVENRPLVYIRLTQTTTPDVEKPFIVVEAGINPREWITIPSALTVVNRLLEANQVRFIQNFEWIIIPVLNPDGYEYTHTDQRMWTKTLTTTSNLGFICPGVNVNRNFDIDWLVSGSSSSPCSHLYGGTQPFSEIESQLVRSIIQTYGSRTRLYISLQNNGGFISYPWQYEFAASGMFVQHHFLALRMSNAMEGNYTLGSGSVVTGERISGTSTDFVQSSGVLYSLNVDLPQSDDGVNIPVQNIVTVAEDAWRAISVAADNFI